MDGSRVIFTPCTDQPAFLTVRHPPASRIFTFPYAAWASRQTYKFPLITSHLGLGLIDRCSQSIRTGLREGCEHAQGAGGCYGCGEWRCTDPLHS
jgi:hypothetical protein